MRSWKPDAVSDWLLRKLFVPVLLVGGLAVVVVGGYRTEGAKTRCRQMAADRGFVHSEIIPNRRGPDDCVCRGRRNSDGTLDMSASERIPMQ